MSSTFLARQRPVPPVTVVVTGDSSTLPRCLESLRTQSVEAAAIVVAATTADVDGIGDGVIAHIDSASVAPGDWIERVGRAFQLDPDLAAVSGPVRSLARGRWRAALSGFRRGVDRAFLGALVGHPLLVGSNWAVRVSDWRETAARAGAMPDGVELALLLGVQRRIRFDRGLRVGGFGSSAEPTLRQGRRTILAHEPRDSALREGGLRVRRRRAAHAAQRRRQRRGSARWRERSRLVRARRLYASRRPVTFTEKVRYKMLRDHRPVIVTFADKAAVRSYVADRIGGHYLPRAYAISADPAIVASCDLPEEFVMKPTHGSGAAFVVSHRAPVDARLPTEDASWVYRHVLPERADRAAMARLGARWLEQLYGQGPNREWAYGRVPRQIIVEELLRGADGSIPDDYKFFVFHGRCEYVQVDDGRFARRTQDFHLPDWQHLPLSGGPPWADPPHPRPARLEEMIRIAETLGAGTDFVRVDLYDLPDRVVFGELTSYPAGGHSPFEPDSFDAEFGSHWTVPRRYTA